MELNVLNTGFRPDAKITITGAEFMLLTQGVEDFFSALAGSSLVSRYRYIDKDGETIESPTQEQMESGEVQRIFDPFKTFNPNNLFEGFHGRMTPMSVEARRILFEIHQRELDRGNVVSIETLQKEMQNQKEFKLELNAED